MSILKVGAGGTYATLAQAIAASHDGDVLQVAAGVYKNDFATINTKITIQGVGGMVQLVATVPPPDGKAILTINTDVTIDHLEFSGAKVSSGNGAGIRYQGGNLTITNSYFHDNQDGLLAASNPAGSITILNSEFAHNGTGDGRTHNIYVNEVGTLKITGSYFHDAVVGHEIKSRAYTTIIDNNRISEGPNGTGSYSIDVPEGGNVTITNNIIQQGAKSQNPAIIHAGNDGPLHAGTTINIAGNTVLNDLKSPSSSLFLNQTGSGAVTLTGNRVFGLTASQLLNGPGSVTGTVFLATEPAFSTAHPFTPAAAPAAPVAVKPTITPDTLVLKLSEDAWQGDVRFIASLDGKALAAAQTVTAAHSAGASNSFSYSGNFGTGLHTLTVDFLNDGFGNPAGASRHLYVEAIQFKGAVVAGVATEVTRAGTLSYALASPGNAAPAHSLIGFFQHN